MKISIKLTSPVVSEICLLSSLLSLERQDNISLCCSGISLLLGLHGEERAAATPHGLTKMLEGKGLFSLVGMALFVLRDVLNYNIEFPFNKQLCRAEL